jgi:hypothetical protein
LHEASGPQRGGAELRRHNREPSAEDDVEDDADETQPADTAPAAATPTA